LLVLAAAAGPARAGDEAAALIRARLAPLLQDTSPLRVAGTAVPRGEAGFYAARDWAPVWDDARYQSLLSALADLYTDGLRPDDYGFSRLEHFPPVAGDPARQAERDMLATHAYLLALVHLYHGKVDPQRLDPNWNFDAREIDPQRGLALAREAAEQGDITAFFNRARPPLPQYNALRSALARLRGTALAGGWPEIPPGPSLKPGMSDARVAVLRTRLQAGGLLGYDVKGPADFYDDDLRAAVARYQEESGLDADGAVGPATRAALNVSVRQRIDQVRANLERMRWFLHGMKEDYVLVDIAGFHIYYFHDNKVAWSARVQVGKAYRATPVFRSAISTITFSPSWVVPPTIFREDSLPAIRRNRGYLARNHLRVFNAAGHEIPASAVNWAAPGNITLRQDPGPDGALGEAAIRFPNPFSVYLHDTPHKELFGSSRRTTSSGCIRVEHVLELVERLFNDPVHWNHDAIRKVIDERKTINVPLPHKVPLLLSYMTVEVGDDGYVSFLDDIYSRDAAVVQALDAPP
jgi:murein L,D-transpeptidase YcbB/YkuD